jgi:Secretory lipase
MPQLADPTEPGGHDQVRATATVPAPAAGRVLFRRCSGWLRVLLPLVAALVGIAVVPPAVVTAAPATTESDFYQTPAPLPEGRPGQLIRYANSSVDLGVGAPAANAWTVMYHSRDARNRDVPVTGTVWVPTTAWTQNGPRPILTLTVGTHGLGPQCAPSRQLVAGTEGEAGKISMALQKGWGVVVADYVGYTTGATPSYLVGPDMAHAALDIVRAAAQVPGAGLEARAPLLVWGYSQGGRASAWATSIQPRYAPELNLVASASGGIPVDTEALVRYLNGTFFGAGLALASLIGNEVTYSTQFPFSRELNAEGRAAVATVKQLCTLDLLITFLFKDLNTYFKPGRSLGQFLDQPSVAAVYKAERLTNQPAPRVPWYQYHGIIDEAVPLKQAQSLHHEWCWQGVRTRLDYYPGGHTLADIESPPMAIQWLDDVLSERPIQTMGRCTPRT